MLFGEFIHKAPRTRLTDAAGTKIVAGTLGIAFGHKSAVDMGIDPCPKRQWISTAAPVNEARVVVQV